MAHNRIDTTFASIAAREEPGLILFLTAGFPDLEATRQLVPALVEAGADAIELGVPFSDPLADGATIQSSSYHALQQGVTLQTCLDLVGQLRERLPETPLMLMGYYNPILSLGLDEFARQGCNVGLDGVIVPDLPTEESQPLREACTAHNVHVIPLLAPTSTEKRLSRACQNASGFVYCISLTGVTGPRAQVSAEVYTLLERVRRHTSLPLAVGFGISRRDHVEALAGRADAVVVGSALVRVLQESSRREMVARAQRFVEMLRGSRPSRGAKER